MTLRFKTEHDAQITQLRLKGMEPGGRSKRADKLVPLEHEDQAALVEWFEAKGIPFIVSISDFYAKPGIDKIRARMWAASKCENAAIVYPWVKGMDDYVERGAYGVLTNLHKRGWRAGEMDVCIPVPSFDWKKFDNWRDAANEPLPHETARYVLANCYHALFMDLKRLKNGRISDEQLKRAEELRSYGNKVAFPEGLEAAKAEAAAYMGVEP